MRPIAARFVGFLTPRRGERRISDEARGRSAALLAAVIACSAADAGAVETHQRQPVDQIAAAAEAFLQARTGQEDPRMSLEAGALDPRLDLPRCSEPLEGFLRRGTEIRSRTIVGVRCTGDAPWKVYVPVDVIVTDDVLVAARTLPAGQVPDPGDLRTERRDVSRLVGGYFSDAAELRGQRLKNPLHAGRIITPAMLTADKVIRRGQTVTLLVRDRNVNIRMTGRALADGALDQRIRVENLGSKRVVEGLVRSPEHVEILVYQPE